MALRIACANRLQPAIVSIPFAQPMRIAYGTSKRKIRRKPSRRTRFSGIPRRLASGLHGILFTSWSRRTPVAAAGARSMKDATPQPGPMMQFAEEAQTPGSCFSDGPMLPEMVVIPPGKFWMGADDEGGRSANVSDKSRHWVQITEPLAVSRFPITFEQWDAYADGDVEVHRPDDGGLGRGRRPVVNVSWEDAERYVSRLSIAAGRPYRLLSEAEWEYCCRARSDAVSSTVGQTPPARSFQPNAFGLFDMDGDVRELVADAWHDTYFGSPTDGSAWGQNDATMWRVVRGAGGMRAPNAPLSLPRSRPPYQTHEQRGFPRGLRPRLIAIIRTTPLFFIPGPVRHVSAKAPKPSS